MLSAYKKAIKVSKGKKFSLSYLLFYIKKIIKVLEDRRFCLANLIAQQI